jgi:phosphinothricin acetyltransferase
VTLIRPATQDDAAAIAAIYAPFVIDTPITFEINPPTPAEIAKRMAAGDGLYPWLVADSDGTIAGYAYATRFRDRPAYRFAVETTVYVDPRFHGSGVGSALYEKLIEILHAHGFAQAIAGITLPNPASVRLHEKAGFQPAGAYRRIGFKLGSWHDVGIWQRPIVVLGDQPDEPRRAD